MTRILSVFLSALCLILSSLSTPDEVEDIRSRVSPLHPSSAETAEGGIEDILGLPKDTIEIILKLPEQRVEEMTAAGFWTKHVNRKGIQQELNGLKATEADLLKQINQACVSRPDTEAELTQVRAKIDAAESELETLEEQLNLLLNPINPTR